MPAKLTLKSLNELKAAQPAAAGVSRPDATRPRRAVLKVATKKRRLRRRKA